MFFVEPDTLRCVSFSQFPSGQVLCAHRIVDHVAYLRQLSTSHFDLQPTIFIRCFFTYTATVH